MELELDERLHGDWCVLSVRGELDLHSSKALEQRFSDIASHDHLRVAVDMQDLSFMDSSALGVLVAEMKRARGEGGELALVAANGTPAKVLSVTKLDQAFPMYASVDDLPTA